MARQYKRASQSKIANKPDEPSAQKRSVNRRKSQQPQHNSLWKHSAYYYYWHVSANAQKIRSAVSTHAATNNKHYSRLEERTMMDDNIWSSTNSSPRNSNIPRKKQKIKRENISCLLEQIPTRWIEAHALVCRISIRNAWIPQNFGAHANSKRWKIFFCVRAFYIWMNIDM